MERWEELLVDGRTEMDRLDRPLILRRMDTPENVAYWEGLEKAARELREQMPDWERKRRGLPTRTEEARIDWRAVLSMKGAQE